MTRKASEPSRVTIEVSGGMVQNVYTTLPMDIEVDILDFDNAKAESFDAVEDMKAYLQVVVKDQHQIY